MAERNCKKCFQYKACKEVASHSGYADINYTESQCKNFISADDVVKVVRCKDCGMSRETEDERYLFCMQFADTVNCQAFCSYGERRST